MPNLKGYEWLILIVLLALLFGAKRLPDAARSLGRSLRIFKAEVREMKDDDGSGTTGSTTVQQVPPQQIQAPPPAVPPVPPAQPGPVAETPVEPQEQQHPHQ